MMLTTGNQLKAARALIGLDQYAVAAAADVNVNTIRSMEGSAAGPISGRAQNVQAVQRALEAAGIEFLNHGQPGVRLRGLRIGDNVRLIEGTSLWGQSKSLQGIVGRVFRIVADGTPVHRITVVYPDGESFEGVEASMFELAPRSTML